MREAFRPKIFISSSFMDRFDQVEVAFGLRQHIIEDADSLPVICLAYERLFHDGIPDADTIIDRCFEHIQDCDLFVFLLSGRHGSGVDYLDGGILSSYLELELFAAAMRQKPILVLHLRDREPEPALLDVMTLLKRAFDSATYRVGDERELRDHFRQVCLRLSDGGEVASGGLLAQQLPDWLSSLRMRSSLQQELEDPALLFLDGRATIAGKAADFDRARALLDQVGLGLREPVEAAKAVSHGAALFRLWAAMREMLDDAGTARRDPLLAPLWDRALGLWGSSASWFGLHGHLWMGPLAAVNSQWVLRRDLSAHKAFDASHDVREPLGARASALYSIAQRLTSRRLQVACYTEAERLASRAVERDKDGAEGAMSIRAHASLRLAGLNRYWKVWHAERDFRRILRIREDRGASPAQIGESKADLGFLLAHTFRSGRGFQLMQEGVALMRTGRGANDTAFLMRGLRKLEEAALHHGEVVRAEAARREIEELAEKSEAFDQRRQRQREAPLQNHTLAGQHRLP